VKLFSTFLIAALAALFVYAARRRIWFALRVGAVVYVTVLVTRLVFALPDFVERWEDLVWPVFGLLVAWTALWLISTRYEQRKRRPRRS
jgi:hypothetical protein